MKTICIGTFKGGVGKTMTVFNIAGILAERGYKVLCVDFDPQGNLTNNLTINRLADGYKGLKEVLEKRESIENVIVKAPVTELPTLDCIGSSIFLTETEFKLFQRANRESLFRNYMEDNKGVFNEYDYILFDTNPSMSILNQNAFAASDKIILVADADMNAVEGVELFTALWEQIREDLRIKEDNVAGLVITKFDKRLSISKDFMEYCKEHEEIAPILYKTIIPNNVKLKESALAGKPINIHSKDSIGYNAYNNLIGEMFEKGVC